jgi:hypothetical protein
MENSSPSPGPVRICTSCGSPVEAGHKFCEICGAKMEELPVCRKCGAQFIAPVKFCELCGTPAMAAETFPEVEADLRGPEPEVIEQEIYEQEFTEPEFPESEAPEPDVVKPAVPEPEYIEPEEPEPDYEEPAPAPIAPAAKKPKAVAEKILPPGPEPGTAPVKKPATFPVNKTLVLVGIAVLLVVIAGVYFVGLPMLKGGNAGPSVTAVPPTPDVTPPPVPADTVAPEVSLAPTPVPTPTLDPLAPLPTEKMPANQVVYFDVQKDQVNKEITILFQRGPGENLISYADIRVTYPDGTMATGMLKPSQGNELILKGSKGADRVEVIAHMYSGRSYRVWDRLHT